MKIPHICSVLKIEGKISCVFATVQNRSNFHMENFIVRLRELRMDKGQKQREVADALGISPSC